MIIITTPDAEKIILECIDKLKQSLETLKEISKSKGNVDKLKNITYPIPSTNSLSIYTIWDMVLHFVISSTSPQKIVQILQHKNNVRMSLELFNLGTKMNIPSSESDKMMDSVIEIVSWLESEIKSSKHS